MENQNWLGVIGAFILVLSILLICFGSQSKQVSAPVSPAVTYVDSCIVDSLTLLTVKRLEDSTVSQFKIVELFTYRGVTVYRFNWPSMYIGSKEGTFQVDTSYRTIPRKGK